MLPILFIRWFFVYSLIYMKASAPLKHLNTAIYLIVTYYASFSLFLPLKCIAIQWNVRPTVVIKHRNSLRKQISSLQFTNSKLNFYTSKITMFNNCKNNMGVTQRFNFYAKLSPAVQYSVIFRIHKTPMYYLLK